MRGPGGAAGLSAGLGPGDAREAGSGRRRPELRSGASVAPMRCRRPPGATKEGAGGPRPAEPGEPRGEERRDRRQRLGGARAWGQGRGEAKRREARPVAAQPVGRNRRAAGRRKGPGSRQHGARRPRAAAGGAEGRGEALLAAVHGSPCSQGGRLGGDGVGVMAPWQRGATRRRPALRRGR